MKISLVVLIFLLILLHINIKDKMYKSKKVTFPLYDSLTLEIIISDDVNKINKVLGEEEDNYYACVWKSNSINKDCKTIVAIFNPANSNNKITPGIISHEAIHVKNIVFRTVGIQPDVDNDEPEAYLTEWVVDQIHSVFKNVDRKKYKNIKL